MVTEEVADGVYSDESTLKKLTRTTKVMGQRISDAVNGSAWDPRPVTSDFAPLKVYFTQPVDGEDVKLTTTVTWFVQESTTFSFPIASLRIVTRETASG
jgi:hypothetical protein